MDTNSSDPLSDLALEVGQHCYGANLSIATLFVQSDANINRDNEERFQISGIPVVGRYSSTTANQKAAGVSFLSDLISRWYPEASRPKIVGVYLPRHFSAVGVAVLPPLIFIFANSTVAAQIRKKVLMHLRSSNLPALRRVWLEPVLTKGSHVRVAIMNAFRRILSDSNLRCSVQGFGRSPFLHIVSGDRERVFNFVSACESFGHMVSHDQLVFAYRAAGRSFQNRLASTFLVLDDGAQPLAQFAVPTRRVHIPPPSSQPVLEPEVTTPLVVPPSTLSYLQRMLSAPVASGSGLGSSSGSSSGRKRPAESSSSDFATANSNATKNVAAKNVAAKNVAAKRSAP